METYEGTAQGDLSGAYAVWHLNLLIEWKPKIVYTLQCIPHSGITITPYPHLDNTLVTGTVS